MKCIHCGEDRECKGGMCSECNEKSRKVWWPKDKEIRARYSRKAKYGLSQPEYLKLMEAQNGACAVCSKRPRKNERSLCVDHDHNTDVVRGLLCHSCNFMIGHARNSIQNLMAGAQYLNAYNWRMADEAAAARKAKRKPRKAIDIYHHDAILAVPATNKGETAE